MSIVNLKSKLKKKYGATLALVVANLGLFGLTNVSNIPSYLIMVGFLLLVVDLYLLVYASLGLGKLYGLPIKRRRRLSIYFVLALSLIIALKSIGGLGLVDVLVMVPLLVMGYVYISYSHTKQQQIN